MAATMAGQQTPSSSSSKPIPIRAAGMKLDTLSPRVQPRADLVKVTSLIMSPVNHNGCFEFDRIIKAGTVVKRTRKTKSWKPIHIVLRPNCLSIYKDKDETKLRHQINLAEITAVARQKDSKKKMDHVFGVFSPARNFHLGASTEKEAQEWVDLIRAEAHIDDEEDEMVLMSPNGGKRTFTGFDRTRRENAPSSSSEAEPRHSTSISPANMYSARRPSHTLNYSGNEHGSVSDLDFSDTGFQGSVSSLPRQSTQKSLNVSQQSSIGTTPDDERVVYHGWLYVLKSKGGVRQWKKLWIVLRAKSLTFYKNDQEYSASLIIPFASIIDAVDVDPVSRSKQHCMQVLSEEKNFRFCATNEDSLAKWLGAFKSLLIKRKEAEQKRVQQATITTGNAGPSQKPTAAPNVPLPGQTLATR